MHINYPAKIRESVQELQARERKVKKASILKRLQILRLLKSGQACSMAQAAHLVGMSSRQATRLWKQYQQEGLAKLCQYNAGGAKEKLTDAEKRALQQAASEGKFATLWQARNYIADQFQVDYTQQGIWYMFKAMKIKRKTARPVHVKQNKEALEAFKKTLPLR